MLALLQLLLHYKQKGCILMPATWLFWGTFFNFFSAAVKNNFFPACWVAFQLFDFSCIQRVPQSHCCEAICPDYWVTWDLFMFLLFWCEDTMLRDLRLWVKCQVWGHACHLIVIENHTTSVTSTLFSFHFLWAKVMSGLAKHITPEELWAQFRFFLKRKFGVGFTWEGTVFLLENFPCHKLPGLITLVWDYIYFVVASFKTAEPFQSWKPFRHELFVTTS